jgi:hypothetical protein
MSMIFELKPNIRHAAKLCRGFLCYLGLASVASMQCNEIEGN